jgi:hypothetical protein
VPSAALEAFVEAMREVAELQSADPTPPGRAPVDPHVSRVIGRASVVLLASHFERYLYAVNEEAASVVNLASVSGPVLPQQLRLLHSRSSIDAMIETSWERRSEQLKEFVKGDGWLWGVSVRGVLDHDRLLMWMKAPTPQNLIRYYRYWDITDIFAAITRETHTRTDMRLKLEELVGKRNNIAHGDPTTEATAADIRSYRVAAERFCTRADRALARGLQRIVGCDSPW